MRLYYNTQRVHNKTWRPLFLFLFDTTITNCFKLSIYRPSDGSRGGRNNTHLQFLKDLRMALLDASTCRNWVRGTEDKRKSINEIIWRPVKEHNLVRLWRKPRNCSACTEASRKVTKKNLTAWKPLADLSANTTRKPRESRDWRRP